MLSISADVVSPMRFTATEPAAAQLPWLMGLSAMPADTESTEPVLVAETVALPAVSTVTPSLSVASVSKVRSSTLTAPATSFELDARPSAAPPGEGDDVGIVARRDLQARLATGHQGRGGDVDRTG